MAKRMSESACDGLEQLTQRLSENRTLLGEVIEELEMRRLHSRPDQAANLGALIDQLRYFRSTEEERSKLLASIYGGYCGS